MGSVTQDKIEMMLRVYREKLERAETAPIEYVLCIRLSAQIGLLEDLYYLARQDDAQQSAQRTVVQACGCPLDVVHYGDGEAPCGL